MLFHPLCLLAIFSFWQNMLPAQAGLTATQQPMPLAQDSLDHSVLESWTYTDDFEDRDLGAWASYPLWQDIAYNQNFRVNEIIPGDPNISIVQKVTPYTAVDNYAGAQKLLDIYLVPQASIKFRYYLKTNQRAESFTVRLAAGKYGKLDVTIREVETNQWNWLSLSYDDFVKENPVIAAKEKVKIHALAFLVKFPKADPDMPIYLGLDDITFEGARPLAFRFSVPEMYKLPEFKPYIPQKHYEAGSEFELNGTWPLGAKEVSLEIVSYTDRNKSLFKGKLAKKGEGWKLKPLRLDFPEGLYLGTLSAHDGTHQISTTEFTLHIAPSAIAGKHPRLLFDAEEKKEIDQRFQEERFKQVYADISKHAKEQREKIPVESLIFDLDQFPDEDWLPSWSAWGSRIYHTGEALRLNARAYAFHADEEAGEYVKQVLLRLSSWPNWTHPWQTKRGRFSEHRTGSWSHRVAEAYDLVYPLMSEEEGKKIRQAMMRNIVQGVHRTYIYNDNITAATSNWLAMTVGGSLMCMAAVYQDGEDTQHIEPYFTGAIMKLDRFLNKVTDSQDGAWGEGFSYNNYSFSNLSYSLPSIENVFNVDLSSPLIGTYNEYIWAGWIKNKRWFEYGDSGGKLASARNWAYLLSKYKKARLSWFYHFLKEDSHEAYEDVIFNTGDIPQKDPYEENPVKLFRDIGTTVFKSGWETDDFVFVMRTGPSYNHQHIDQGSFWLADRGKLFVEERPLKHSDYYDDPLYESWFTQPVGHSTILVNGNDQSQRLGDPLAFAAGFDEHAYVSHFLDGQKAAFSSGHIGKLYWGQVEELSRNVLYLKPRTLLMLDVALPSKADAEITLLYQTEQLKDIQIGEKKSMITKDEAIMHIFHLAPADVVAKAVETPHFLRTLQAVSPLEREGMLTISSHTYGEALVMANLLTTSLPPHDPQLSTEIGEGYVSGLASGQKFAFSTKPDSLYTVENFSTDALAISWDDERVFVAKATFYEDENMQLSSDVSITFECSSQAEWKYYLEKDGQLSIKLDGKPTSISLNGRLTEKYVYEVNSKILRLQIPKGAGEIKVHF